VLDAVNRGWWTAEGTHQPWNDNTLTGYCGNCTPAGNYWSYFSFDLSGLSSKVVSVTLVLELEFFFGGDGSETVRVSDVSTPADTLENGTTNSSVFADLGGGQAYGSYTAVANETGSLLKITLNAQAVADVNAALGGDFSVGLSTTSLTQSDVVEALRFSSDSEARVHQLVLGLN
jgi:hypothetical protein